MLRVYLKPPSTVSQSIFRVARALAAYAPPTVNVVSDLDKADLQIVHAIGWGSFEKLPRIPRAIVQYCVRSTEDSNPTNWLIEWQNAKVVWSYYDLKKYVSGRTFNFYYAPLGVSRVAFFPRVGAEKVYGVATSGYVPESESVREVFDACQEVGLRQFHLGPPIIPCPPAVSRLGISDNELAQYYSESRYVSGLRRCEGFELPALEGLVCGARPILYKQESHLHWYGSLAEYVDEGHPDDVRDQLISLLKGQYRSVTDQERIQAYMKFDWATICRNFWREVLA
jgi:hypothetical protein